MKRYEVHRVIKSYGRQSSEKLRAEVETLLNEKTQQGYEVVSVQFDLGGAGSSGYIYAFVTLKI